MRRNFTHPIPQARTLFVVSWNIGMGRGDVPALLAHLRAKNAGAEVVLLLQEAFRKGPEVPSDVPPSARFAGKLASESTMDGPQEIERVADASGLDLYYVPSMRNGAPSRSDEDRGNAILSSLVMSNYEAVELPFERQRRVAVAATISGSSSTHTAWQLRVVSAHLDNLAGPRRMWFVAAELARTRQLRGLLQYLQDDQAVVLGGDLNTWSGFDERAYREAARAFPETAVIDRRPTFGGHLRLDHLFLRLDDGWRGEFRRAESSYRSDHFPLIATITLP